jgi:nitrite reductase (NADH) small subunit
MTTDTQEDELALSPEGRGFQKVATMDQLPDDRGFRVKLEEKYVALFKVNGKVYAIDAICPHAGAFLDMGYMDDHCVICPMHGWDFDVRTGTSPTYGINTHSYEIEVQGDDVYLKC